VRCDRLGRHLEGKLYSDRKSFYQTKNNKEQLGGIYVNHV
jgi:hypothetical protein